MKAYIGTYEKYNRGSLRGEWVDLADFDGDMDAFFEHCCAIHADEADPEFMVQSWEDAPAFLARSESVTAAALEYAALSENEQAMVAAYIDICGAVWSPTVTKEAEERFVGVWNYESDAADEIVENALDNETKIPDWVFIDYQLTWKNTLRHDYSSGESGGQFWVFFN